MSYRKEIVDQIAGTIGLSGKRVLEIGSDQLLEAAGYLSAAGAASVTASNVPEEWSSRQSGDPRIHCVRYDVRGEYGLPDRDYDVIVGIAVLEHIRDLRSAIGGMLKLLRPGSGRLFLHGCPIWNSRKGHHLWVQGERFFKFNDAQANPIPDWGHLRGETWLRKHLETAVGDADRQAILEWVFRSRAINRTDLGSIIEAADVCGRLIALEQRSYGPLPSSDLQVLGATHVADLRIILGSRSG